ncbi:MAG: polyhydroxyalkanoate synthesis repressor PhaR [Woeseiaceae bacterium]|nr:polyhydroxyalkanoate synthesis repressor PhaR [Woeseiaceae bacterium]
MAKTRLIKKYANRRLYDTETSSHITVDGIHDLIVAGYDVKIVDDQTGEDISRSVLLQIIADREQAGRPMLDTDLLTRMIRLYGNPMQDMAGEFLSRSFDAFMDQQARFREQMRKAMAATPLETINKLTADNLKAWQAMQDAFLKKTGRDDDTTE